MMSQQNVFDLNNNMIYQYQFQNQYLLSQSQENEQYNYICYLKAQILKAQQIEAEQQLLNFYAQKLQYAQNSQLLLPNYYQSSGLVSKQILYGQQQLGQNQNVNQIPMNISSCSQLYPNDMILPQRRSICLSPQLSSTQSHISDFSHHNIQPKIENLPLQDSYCQISNQSSQRYKLPIQNKQIERNNYFCMQQPKQEESQQVPSIVKKIKKSCTSCSNCTKKEQLNLERIPSCSSSQSSESTSPIYQTEEKQTAKLSQKKQANPKSNGKKKISRLEETRAERWSFLKKFYSKQILINRIFIDLEDENFQLQPIQINQITIKKEDGSNEEESSDQNKSLNNNQSQTSSTSQLFKDQSVTNQKQENYKYNENSSTENSYPLL
ncbi:hypothetical protein ABPG72_004052 [Tetrahymena utriculariae]